VVLLSDGWSEGNARSFMKAKMRPSL